MNSVNQEKIIQIVKDRLIEPVESKYLRLTVVQGLNKDSGMPVLAVWVNKQKMPFCNLGYTNEGARAEYLEHLMDDEKRKYDFIQQRKKTIDFDVGDVFVGSWGFEQTNVDAYQVVDRPSKCYAVIRKLKTEVVRRTGDMSMIVKPCVGVFASEDVAKVRVNGFGIKLGNYLTLKPWDGERGYGVSSYG